MFKGKKVWHHDHLFWCGDFNYRIDLGKDEVKDLIAHKNWPALQAYDQLNVQRQAGNVCFMLVMKLCYPIIIIIII